MKTKKTRRKVTGISQISKGFISELAVGKLGSRPQINTRIDD